MWLYTLKIPGFGKHVLYEESAKMTAQTEVRLVFIYIACSDLVFVSRVSIKLALSTNSPMPMSVSSKAALNSLRSLLKLMFLFLAVLFFGYFCNSV